MSAHIYKIVLMMAKLALLASQDVNFTVLDTLTGNDCEVYTPSVRLVASAREWDDVWTRSMEGTLNTGARPNTVVTPAAVRPRVDFEENVVVAVFAGNQQNVDAIRVVGWDRTGEHVVVRVAETRNPTPVGRVTTAYLFMVVPRTQKPLEIQMPVRAKGKVDWTTAAVFPATDGR